MAFSRIFFLEEDSRCCRFLKDGEQKSRIGTDELTAKYLLYIKVFKFSILAADLGPALVDLHVIVNDQPGLSEPS